MPIIKKPQKEVLEWMHSHHPHLHTCIEIERHWLWLAGVNLSGKENEAIRAELKSQGWQYKPSGDHVLPSGKTARWAHHAEHPIPYFRKGKGASKSTETIRHGATPPPKEIDPASVLDWL